ncbi:hypothetical protein F383_03851 [Gossypium arboreum]|uniref:Uncharacterized protein n=1 Tax=Gossypium arboreum TaxID=29729 RepID=A0A0B0NVD7_GOSAR|nr:hypothetical protein F383_03851 [Gossypium arboreum]
MPPLTLVGSWKASFSNVPARRLVMNGTDDGTLALIHASITA